MPARLGPVTLANRIIKSATFEGMSPQGLVTDNLVDYHRAVAAGGVGMTTLAYCAVSRDGRGAPGEIVPRDDALPGLRRFVDEMHALGTAASMQLGHAGPVAANTGRRGLAPSKVFAPQAMKFTQAATAADIARVTADFANATRIAVAAGFDAVELHFGHGYLVSAFLSPRLNRRDDQWGGSAEKRARLAREVSTAVRDAAAGRVAVIAKLNMDDGVKGGLGPEDALVAARLLEGDGALDAIELTGGSSFQNPMYLFRGDAPVHEMAATLPPLMRFAFRLTSRKFMPAYPFEEAFFLPTARRFRGALTIPLILLGGITTRATVEQAMAEGFDFVAIGRALLREPGLVNRWRAGDVSESLCTHCNKCIPTIYAGTHCVLVPAAQRPGRAV
ncbi:MAG: NADH:flavin oxidoreductase [Actinobacteria bacterium]|nr:NADH:flavin oxidoreductase [Actinomycetota bacterium]